MTGPKFCGAAPQYLSERHRGEQGPSLELPCVLGAHTACLRLRAAAEKSARQGCVRHAFFYTLSLTVLTVPSIEVGLDRASVVTLLSGLKVISMPGARNCVCARLSRRTRIPPHKPSPIGQNRASSRNSASRFGAPRTYGGAAAPASRSWGMSRPITTEKSEQHLDRQRLRELLGSTLQSPAPRRQAR